MLAFILVLYCCNLWKACYMWEIKDGREPHWKERKEKMAKGKEKEEKKKKKNKAEGLKEKKWKHKVLEYAKGIRVKRKMREAQSAWEKKWGVACFVGSGFIVLQVYVVATCLYYWSLTTIHHSSFILAFHATPKVP